MSTNALITVILHTEEITRALQEAVRKVLIRWCKLCRKSQPIRREKGEYGEIIEVCVICGHEIDPNSR